MATLPNCERAAIDLRKLEDYCLNPAHPRGRHKARVFHRTLGLQRGDARWLRDALQTAVAAAQADVVMTDDRGQQWRADIAVTRHDRALW
ncbi:MAG: hypothetical protein FJX62_14980 [Alphaproteobacteria bacterium]|nr:hypothetical protein [Alphaproteobacteria bacterium]